MQQPCCGSDACCYMPLSSLQVHTEHLTTLFVVVSKYGIKEWEASYERLCDYVVRKGLAVQRGTALCVVG